MSDRPIIAVVVKTWPRLSETFIARELFALEARGFDLQIWSLRYPADELRHPLYAQIAAPVYVLPVMLRNEPWRVLRSLVAVARISANRATLGLWLRDFLRDPTRRRLRRIGQAAVLAAELDVNVRVLYAHFLNAPASVARYAAILRGLPWGFSAHAKDIWLTPDWEKREKIISADFGMTCTAFGADHLRTVGGDPDKITVGYHGLDLTLFPPPSVRRDYRDGSVPSDPVRFLSVGRLVEKKGFDTLIAALALLPPSLAWRWDHVGAGPQDTMLRAEVLRLGLADRVFWHGPQTEPTVIAAMRQADLFVLPCRITSDGDRDGLPNVLIEAASQKLAIVATPVAAIPEFVVDSVHGVLACGEPTALANALVGLAREPGRRAELAAAAYRRLESDFGIDGCLAPLETRLRNSLLLQTNVR